MLLPSLFAFFIFFILDENTEAMHSPHIPSAWAIMAYLLFLAPLLASARFAKSPASEITFFPEANFTGQALTVELNEDREQCRK